MEETLNNQKPQPKPETVEPPSDCRSGSILCSPVSVLCAARNSIYYDMEGVEVFDVDRDARTFRGDTPIIGHPPCRGWSAFLAHQAKPAAGEKELGLWVCDQLYVDSPYVIDNKTRSGSGKYLHDFESSGDMFADDPHERLRDVLTQYKHVRIVVSYYDCPRVRELYSSWTFIDKERQKHLHAQNGRGARPKKAPEVLIVNGDMTL